MICALSVVAPDLLLWRGWCRQTGILGLTPRMSTCLRKCPCGRPADSPRTLNRILAFHESLLHFLTGHAAPASGLMDQTAFQWAVDESFRIQFQLNSHVCSNAPIGPLTCWTKLLPQRSHSAGTSSTASRKPHAKHLYRSFTSKPSNILDARILRLAPCQLGSSGHLWRERNPLTNSLREQMQL